jgi:hypothetical protein
MQGPVGYRGNNISANTASQNTNRLHCLNWLRVIAIGVLLMYHIGMVYVPDWGYHYKNPLASDWIKSLMLLTSPWRMGLLWFNLVVTPLICALLVRLIARFNAFRLCFGMRLKKNRDPYSNWQANFAVLVICTPIIYCRV